MTANDSKSARAALQLPHGVDKLRESKQPVCATDAGQRFYEQYKDWVDAMNEHFNEHGVFGEEWRRW